MGSIVLDSSVVIALLDPQDSHHKSCMKEFEHFKSLDKSSFFLSSITIAESLVGAFKKSYEYALEVFSRISEDIGVLVSFNIESAWLTAKIRSSSQIGFADAMIVATAEQLGAQLWTCDQKLLSKYKSVKYLGDLN